VVLAREFLVTGIRGYVESLGSQFPADWFGKVKMVMQCLAVESSSSPSLRDPGADLLAVRAIRARARLGDLLTSIGSCISYLLKTRQLLLERS